MQHPYRRSFRGALFRAALFTPVAVSALALAFAGCGDDQTGPGGGGDGAGASSGTGGGLGTGGAGTGTGNPTGACSPGLGAPSGIDESGITAPAQAVSDFIVVDQFGYLPESEKIAVLRNPETGFDATEEFTPGATYRLIDAATGETALEGAPTAWNGGAVDDVSGDSASWFDFSSVTTPGVYYVLDVDQDVRSDVFVIASDVYRAVLREAVRTFYYQRAGFAKEAPYAAADWVDGASHVGAGQDTEARLFSAKTDASTARDLSGGWYDAGDYNKYTGWTAEYVISMLRAYSERPEAFGDDYDLPDSGNCIADIVDEARFGLAHLARLQEADGSVLSIVGLAGASPPSAATDPSYYGPASTSATLRAAAAYAYGALVFAEFDATYAAELTERATRAFAWAEANPDVRFFNNDAASGSTGLGAGQQELGEDQRWMVSAYRIRAALLLYKVTGDASYRDLFEQNYLVSDFSLFSTWLSGWSLEVTDTYLDYVALPDADPTISSAITSPFNTALGSGDNLGAVTANPDPYLAHQTDYVWGSNAQKSRIGSLLYSYQQHPGLDPTRAASGVRGAARYVHYIHGVNPLGMVYLTNMGALGAHRSASQIYHTWFNDGTAWDENPAPGFLAGGPNEQYDWDAQCPGHEMCPADRPSPPYDQPPMKSYADFNTNWPVNSWSVTENSDGYQIEYIRLLSKFVN